MTLVSCEKDMCFPIARRANALVLGLSLLLCGCSTTPLDAVIAEDSGASLDAGGSSAGPCFAAAPGRFVLRSAQNALCLGSGAATTVFGSPAFETRFDADCTSPAQTWDLALAGSASVFSLKNVGSADDLDVRAAAAVNGTPVIVYAATGFDNQRFEARARPGSSYELRPQHASASCVAAAALGAVISTCAPADIGQAWQLERSDCL